MSSIFSIFKAPTPTSNVVKGTPEEIAKYVHEDILAVKIEIKKYNELTGILNTNTFYYKMFKLIESEHYKEMRELKERNEYNTKTPIYHKQLLALYKKQLQEICDLLEILKNNYNHGLYESHIVKHRKNGVVPRSSNASTASSSIRSISTEDTDESEIVDKIAMEAPDNLLDPISFNLFSDPVVTPSGITYERTQLMNHIQRKGTYDPLTRTPFKPDQLYPNLAIKDTVEDYIKTKIQELKSVSV